MASVYMRMAEYVLLQSWQIVLVFLVVVVACRLLGRASAHWRYALWLVVLVKCFVPSLVTVPVGLLPNERVAGGGSDLWFGVSHGGHAGGVAEVDAARAGTNEKSLAIPSATWPAVPAGAPDRGLPLTQVDLPTLIDPWNWVAIAWATGALLLLSLAGIRAGRIQRQIRRHRRAASGPLAGEAARLSRQVGMARVPAVWLVDGIAQPFVWGVLPGVSICPAISAAAARLRIAGAS
ncbi:MAG: hypothetical protein QM765_44665 [Myxococcales bacterium]